MTTRLCLLEPPADIWLAAEQLRRAVDLHKSGHHGEASELFAAANSDLIREWTEAIWGKHDPAVLRIRVVLGSPPLLGRDERVPTRMPTASERRQLVQRDGYYCRFCGIPLVPREIRRQISAAYPLSVPWGRTNASQHAALQAMWLQYDHVVPHARGGDNSLQNVVITCAPCNFGRMNHTLSEMDLADPRDRLPSEGDWNGLTDFSVGLRGLGTFERASR